MKLHTFMTKELENRLRQIPFFQKFRFDASDLKEGTARLTAPYDPTYNGVFNCFHGGLLMTLADTAACASVLTVAVADAVISTTDMNIRFLLPAIPTQLRKQGSSKPARPCALWPLNFVMRSRSWWP
jgi:uncharacterized protein (TIGR00369 family)